jgi:hypothetical protein
MLIPQLKRKLEFFRKNTEEKRMHYRFTVIKLKAEKKKKKQLKKKMLIKKKELELKIEKKH